ncbi:MAG: His/Gly/Thr/Pro-type tRNA ligase C-terminal domain-containing protein, partial [Deltaproteobacteria bacterium]
FSSGQLKNRMKRADRLGARYVVILGEDELSQGVVTVKDMASALQEKLSWDDVPGRVLKGAAGAGAAY